VSPARLVAIASGEDFPIEGSVTIGRSECDVTLEDDLVSRRHAIVRSTPGGLEIEDLGSRNGTLVNGERIEPVRSLREGDIVEIGEFRLRVEGIAAVAVTRAAEVVQPTAAAPVAPRGDVPAPAPAQPSAPKEAPTPAAPFQAGAAGRRSRRSAARSGSATLIAFGIIGGTAAALVAYFADRGL
jgi:predicted component of type VI protein secretion system